MQSQRLTLNKPDSALQQQLGFALPEAERASSLPHAEQRGMTYPGTADPPSWQADMSPTERDSQQLQPQTHADVPERLSGPVVPQQTNDRLTDAATAVDPHEQGVSADPPAAEDTSAASDGFHEPKSSLEQRAESEVSPEPRLPVINAQLTKETPATEEPDVAELM